MNEKEPQIIQIIQITELQRKLSDLQERLPSYMDSSGHAQLVEEMIVDLQASLEELHVAYEELNAQNDSLTEAHHMIQKERQRYLDLFEFAPDSYIITDMRGKILEANRAATSLFGIEWSFLRGKPLPTYIAAESRRDFRLRLEMAAELGENQEWEVRIQPRHRVPFDAAVTTALIRGADGEPLGLRWIIRDITDRKQAEGQIRRFNAELEERVAERTRELEAANRAQQELLVREQSARQKAEELQRRFRFLAEASEVMSSSLCYEDTLRTVAHMAIPRLADWCVVDIIEEDGSIWRLAVASDDPVRERLGRRMLSSYGKEETQNRLLATVIATGAAELISEITDDLLLAIAQDSHHLELLRKLAPTSLMVVPLVTRGRTLGAITLVGTLRPRYTAADLDLAEELAHRAALAVDNARLYRRTQLEIAERERIEEQLSRSEFRFRRLYHSDMISICFFDLSGAITNANDAFLRMAGYTRADLEEGVVRWDQLTPPDWLPQTMRAVEAMKVSGKYIPYEKEYIRRDGTRFPVLIGGAMIDQHEGVAFVLDLSSLKQSERELQARMSQLQAIYTLTASVARARSLGEIYEEAIEGLHHALGLDRASILLFDSDGVMRFKLARGLSERYIRAVEGHSPWAPDERDPSPILFPDIAEASDLDPELRRTILAEGIGALAFVPLVYQGDLLGKVMLYWNAPHRFGEMEIRQAETIAGHIAFAIGRKNTEDALQAAKERAEEANRAKDHFLAILSHELRNPLTPVIAAAHALQEESAIPEDLRPMIGMILRNAQLQGRLIDDLLDLTRIVKGKLNLAMERVNVHDVLRDVMQICREDIEQNAMTLRLDLAARDVWVMADPVRLQQIFWNILKNAVKFTPPGGAVTVRSFDCDGAVVVEVTDSGAGIEPQDLDRIFGAFEQVERDGHRGSGGLGLGLAITRALVERQEGTIAVTSGGRGTGATFTVSFPALRGEEPDQSESAGGNEESAAAATRARILLVEDHPDTRRVLDLLLTHRGHTVAVAGSVATAVELAASSEFDLLLSDLNLPDGSGLDLVRMVRRVRPMKAIVLSGYNAPEDIAMAREAGFDLHLGKPVDSRKLCNAIDALIAG